MLCLFVCYTVTEKEIKHGLLDIEDANKHCLWFQRNLRGIDKAEPSRLVSRFTGKDVQYTLTSKNITCIQLFFMSIHICIKMRFNFIKVTEWYTFLG